MQTLSGKTALVTGAGVGIGHAICKTLAAQGAAVIAVARNQQNLAALQNDLPGNNHQYWSIDLASDAGQQQLLQQLEQHSFPHIVVNNLNIPSQKKRLINTTKQDFADSFSVNIDHLFVIMEKVLQFQRAENFGRWVGISSLTAQAGIPGQTIYGAQKSAMEAVFINLAVEEGKYGITSNLVAPGFIDTPSVEARVPKAVSAMLSTTNVLKRAGTPEEVAAAVAFFASPAASYITGIVLPVCGGAQLAWYFS
ncbi:SDR family oxidoreductase [Panacibacter sp. DH6]|uniref:SDR family oxidoreductase n=1 Tax=Panacibacter microcysteis TaxID=2793269 RepID=A0A931H0J6_9BACT|nr:SDR family oxidoreductase [Panacibacter microcysteis]MBG9378678.1 SDR family oxidoreductase [Panacibacter microcysteis]